MEHVPASFQDRLVELVNDDQTPYDFVVATIQSVFAKSSDEARALARAINDKGLATLGPYAPAVAKSMVDVVTERARAAGYPLLARLAEHETSDEPTTCSFCGRAQADCKFLYQGRGSLICDACVINGARALHTATPSQAMRNIFEILDWHFGGVPESNVISVERTFPIRMRVDLQRALDDVLTKDGIRVVGIHGGHPSEAIGFTALFGERRYPKTIGPLQFEEIDIGADAPARVLVNALWLTREADVPVAVLLARRSPHDKPGINVTVAAPAGTTGQRFADALFGKIESALAEAKSYRGKVLSLETHDHYRGMATGVTVHRLPAISRDEVVLPEKTVQLLDRNVIEFAALRDKLVALNQSGKKGLLFHGPPGTGKTHTVRYLAARLRDHTVFIVTAEQVTLIRDYFALARLLQPSILVIEDADLIARSREDMRVPGEEVLLNQLLNELDGLKPDAAIFVILTTNRPKALEVALSQRPGRVDQAIEFPLPDYANRLKLIQLYQGNLELADELASSIATKTEGVSAAFIKELMRRLAQAVIERGSGSATVIPHDVEEALGELALGNNELTATLLGVASCD